MCRCHPLDGHLGCSVDEKTLVLPSQKVSLEITLLPVEIVGPKGWMKWTMDSVSERRDRRPWVVPTFVEEENVLYLEVIDFPLTAITTVDGALHDERMMNDSSLRLSTSAVLMIGSTSSASVTIFSVNPSVLVVVSLR